MFWPCFCVPFFMWSVRCRLKDLDFLNFWLYYDAVETSKLRQPFEFFYLFITFLKKYFIAVFYSLRFFQNASIFFSIAIFKRYIYLPLTDCPALISSSSLDGSDRQVTLKVLIILLRVTFGLYQLWTLWSAVGIDTMFRPRVLLIKKKKNDANVSRVVSAGYRALVGANIEGCGNKDCSFQRVCCRHTRPASALA